jgi:hypothetical protein
VVSALLAPAAQGAPYRQSLAGRSPSLANASPHEARAECRYSTWSAPARVNASAQDHRVARFPSIAMGGETPVVVGSDIRDFSDRTLRPPLLVAGMASQADLGRPAGRFLFLFPRASRDSDGVVHLVWGEPDTAGASTTYPPTVRSLWYARYRGDSGWSDPVLVLRARQLSWDEVQGSAPLIGVGGELRLAVPIRTDSGPALLALPTLRAGHWSVLRIRVGGMLAYARMARTSDGRIVIGYIAADNSAPHDRNSVFVLRSGPDGNGWTRPRVVSRSGSEAALDLRVFAGNSGAVHFVWAQSLSGALTRDVVRHVVSNDGGASWSTLPELKIPANAWSFTASIDRCESIHVVIVTMRGSREHLSYARWDGAIWTAPSEPFPSLEVPSADIASDGSGDVSLVWLGRRSNASDTAAFSTMWSRLHGRIVGPDSSRAGAALARADSGRRGG